MLRIDLIANRIRNYVYFYKKICIKILNHYQNILKNILHLLIYGEIPRNSVKDVLGVSKPTAIKIVKELEKREYITLFKPLRSYFYKI